MSLKNWFENRWLAEHETSAEEVADLLKIADRDLAAAKVPGLDPDWQMAISYNAALQLATVALAAKGYRPERLRAHPGFSPLVEVGAGKVADLPEPDDPDLREIDVLAAQHEAGRRQSEVEGVFCEVVRIDA